MGVFKYFTNEEIVRLAVALVDKEEERYKNKEAEKTDIVDDLLQEAKAELQRRQRDEYPGYCRNDD